MVDSADSKESLTPVSLDLAVTNIKESSGVPNRNLVQNDISIKRNNILKNSDIFSFIILLFVMVAEIFNES